MSEFLVSVIIPAHNAAGTLGETLASLLAQTRPDWEAIVVDDGSTDGTADRARSFAQQGHAIQLKVQRQQGVCAARNAGLALARGDWVLFLDADDWLEPDYLERMLARLEGDPSLDAVHCGWCRIAPDGTRLTEKHGDASPDLFPTLARHCPFAIHACIARKAMIEAVGGFDTALTICEDWDLWQRLARAGARFGSVPQTLALYRMRPGSLSRDPLQFYRDALVVLERAHAPDPRLRDAIPQHVQGRPRDELPLNRMALVTWLAGLLLGEGKDARGLIKDFPVEPIPGLGANWIAENLFEAAVLQDCGRSSDWASRWPAIHGVIATFLAELEERACTPGLARRTCIALERLVVEHADDAAFPVGIGSTYGLRFDVTVPCEDRAVDPEHERLYCRVVADGERLGVVELAVCDGLISRDVLADAVAARCAWAILGQFFEETIYRPYSTPEVPLTHAQIGWQVFLQQLWQRPGWSLGSFYDPGMEELAPPNVGADGGEIELEIGEPLPDVCVDSPALGVLLRVAGTPLARFSVPAVGGYVSAAALRVALLGATGFELCVAVVRESLIGQPWHNGEPLPTRLAAVRRRAPLPLVGRDAAAAWSAPTGAALVIGRRFGPVGSSVSRLARLPRATAPGVLQAADVVGDWIACRPAADRQPQSVVYAPAMMPAVVHPPEARSRAVRPMVSVRPNDRSDFETLFATQPDPWKYTSAYEQTKYEQTLSLLPSGRIGRALELACAEGHFTLQLADRVENLIAADISLIALERTRERCRDRGNVAYRRIDLTSDPLPQDQDLIVCSEVLYYVGDREQLARVACAFAAALKPGGYALLAHANAVVDDPEQPGFDWDVPYGGKTIGEVFGATSGLSLRKAILTPLYRIHLFQREVIAPSIPAEITRFDRQPTELPAAVASHVLWQGGQPRIYASASVITEALPVLMYHRVAPGKDDAMRRYRVSPESFEEQLQYLRDAGFYSVGWDEWEAAAASRSPLPGRAIAITFDDGYLDVYEYAAPLLERYGFSAWVFLVADRVGGSNVWDQAFAEPVPLMGWGEIRELQARGLEFGSHTATHRALTGLPIADIVDEGIRSRAIIQEALGVPVRSIAYPYGDFDPAVVHLMGGCGYVYGLSCRPGRARFGEPLLALPRIEIDGTDTLRDFVAKLAG